MRTVLTNFAALTAASFPTGDPTSRDRYAAMAQRISTNLAVTDGVPSVQDMVTDMSQAKASLGSAATRVKATTTQLQDTIDGIETADPTETATKLMAVQTRLQASYQTTATIAKLSLVNFL